eukprot:m.57740 g.57740  ORF g.57740 m.57740 type:complete len:374 (-) comp17132_c1_seq1:734-1855(-)
MNFFLDAGANGSPHSVIPTGRNQMCWDSQGYNGTLRPGQARVTLAEYQAIVLAQMDELLGGGYGHNFGEIWLDGGYPPVLADKIATLIDRNQPQAVTFQGPGWNKTAGYSGNVVRWAGTETGHTPSADMWSTVDENDAGPGTSGNAFGHGAGSPDGEVFMPAEQDAAIQTGPNEGGFWYPGETPKAVSELLNEYEDSVGHNANLMLELSPDRTGAIPAADLAAYAAFGTALAKCYVAPAVPVGNTSSVCSYASGCVVMLPHLLAAAVDRIRIAEAYGTRAIRAYTVEASLLSDPDSSTSPPTPTVWTSVATGKSVGHGRIHRLATVVQKGTLLRLRITSATAPPVLRSFAALNLYQDGGCLMPQRRVSEKGHG